jgi:hypothetical protein
MIGSMLSISRVYNGKALEYLYELLNDGGKIFIMEDIKHKNDYSNNHLINNGDYVSPDKSTRINILKKI